MNKVNKLFFYIIILCIFSVHSGAQVANVDSLLVVIKSGKEDTSRVKDYYRLSVGFRAYGVLDTAVIFANKAIELGKKLKFNKYVLYTYSDLGITYATMGKFQEALQSFSLSLKIAKDLDMKKDVGNAYNNIGNVYRMNGKAKEALEAYDQSFKLRQEIKDTVGLADSYVNIGLTNFNNADYSEALSNYNKALKIRKELKNSKALTNLLNNIGSVYLLLGNFDETLKYYYEALTIREQMGDKRGMAESYSNFGVVYQKQENLDEALEATKKALKLYQEINDKDGIGGAFNNIGAIYEIKENHLEALKWFAYSLKIREELSDIEGIALIKTNTGIIHEKAGNYTEALKDQLKAQELYEKIGYKQGVGIALCNIGSVYFHLKNFPEALSYFDKSLKVCDEIGDIEGKREAEEGLSKVYDAMAQPAKAYIHYKNFIAYRDSLINESNIKKGVEAKMQYEFTKKETETKLIQDKKDAISAEEKEKQSIIRNSFIAGFCLIFILALVIFRSYSNKKKANIVITKQKNKVENQKHIIEEKNREIIDSINYAKRIQFALLAHEEFLRQHLDMQFILFNPKDIVSGDFYWATEHNNKFYLAVCDSTGHGVPGAFMSLLSIGFLNEAIIEKGIVQPNHIFDYVRERLISNISKEGQKDGFDGILICIDKANKEITYAAANNGPVFVTNSILTELKADKMPVGLGERKDSFTLYNIDFDPDMMLYLYTDGYADQFGGPKGKKFRYKQLEDLLVSVSDKNMSDQKEILENTLETWKGNLEQVDDISIIGLKIKF